MRRPIDDQPQPPRRLMTDYVLQRFEAAPPAWEGRNTHDMTARLRTPFSRLPLANIALIAPVPPMAGTDPFHRAV